MSMELLLVVLAFVVLDALVWFFGADSRDGFADPRIKRPGLPVR